MLFFLYNINCYVSTSEFYIHHCSVHIPCMSVVILWMGSLTKPKRQTRHRRRTDGGSTTISPLLYWWHVCVSTCLQDCWRSDTPTRLGNLYAMEKKRKQKGSLGTPCCLSLQQCSHSRYCALLLLSRDLTCLVFRHLGNIVYMIQWSVAGSSTNCLAINLIARG